MAASSARSTHGPCKMLAFALLLVASLFSAGIMAQEDEVVPATVPSVDTPMRGDMIPLLTQAPETEDPQVQILIFPTLESPEPSEQTTAAAATETPGNNEDNGPAAPEVSADEGTDFTVNIQTEKPESVEPETAAHIPSRGDGPDVKPQPVPGQDDVICVSKEAIDNRNAVNLKLRTASSCKDTKVRIGSVLQELCGEDCTLEIYQEDNSDEILVSGKYVEDDVTGMTKKFNNDNIKDKTDVEEAFPHWGGNYRTLLAILLLAGLFLATAIVAAFYIRTNREVSKGIRLGEIFQVDEENQANTLVSVAPLPQEPIDKPTVNGESPPENGTNSTPTTNGHSATQTLMADTEM